jgi:hypothetical protein
VEKIHEALLDAYKYHIRGFLYWRRAAVLSCAGEPTAIARQYVLPLVSVQDWETVASVENDDLFALREMRLETRRVHCMRKSHLWLFFFELHK